MAKSKWNGIIAVCSCFSSFKEVGDMQEHDKRGHEWTWLCDIVIKSEVLDDLTNSKAKYFPKKAWKKIKNG